MQNVEKVDCAKCENIMDDCGEHAPSWQELAEYWRDKALSTVEQSSIVASTVKQNLKIEPVNNRYKLDFDDLAQWVDDGCPEGVSGKVEDVRALLELAKSLHDADLKKRMSDAVTLLYTHGVLTEKMRAHCRRELS